MRARAVFIVAIALAVFVADQISKFLVSSFLELNQPWYPLPFLKPIFALTYIQNTGAAFGILQNQNLFFTIVAIVVVGAIIYYLRQNPRHNVLVALALGLQLGGACGNLADRLRFGYVIDFIHFSFWAISNVADACITAGVIILGYYLLFRAPAAQRWVEVNSEPEQQTDNRAEP